ncbi:MAG: hypothetical protein Q9226_004643 [Calogaya cf. arnoldii]
MDHVSIANLEAELACLDKDVPKTSHKRDHGNVPHLFEIPNGSTSSLDPPSKTKSTYPFGLNGILAWTTPAGELLQVASCIDNHLVGVDYKRSIDRGCDYSDRGKILERALDSPQGSGFGIGLSLGMSLEPIERSWLHNRWPRFTFSYNGLEIVLQYIIDDQSIIQEYHIRNNGQEEVPLPYLVSSDVCFREHNGPSGPFHPVPAEKSAQRLLLFQNTEVLIQNDIETCQFRMAFFHNSKKRCLWAKSGLNEDLEKKSVRKSSLDSNIEKQSLRKSSVYSTTELDDAEEQLRSRILEGQLVDENADNELTRRYRKCYDGANTARQSASHDSANFACHEANLIVPAGSTQELRIVIQLSGLKNAKLGLLDPQSEPLEPTQEIDNGDGQLNTEAKERIRSRQKLLTVKKEQIPARSPGLEGKRQLTQIINDHIDLGLACTAIDSVAEARYHLLMACLIAEYLYREGSYALSNARYIYAKFLGHHGWHSKALEILERLSRILSKAKSTTKEFTVLRAKVQIRLANMYLGETGSFAEAERIYESALSNPTTEEEEHQLALLERIKATCRGHLVWVFKIAKFNDTWASVYPVRGFEDDNTPSENQISPSRAIEGAYHFSKLWLYLSTWHADWDFVLDLLHSKLNGWLGYLACSRHMDNLWVERQGYELLRPYDTISADCARDTISGDYAGTSQWFPEYQLSDFTMLWLALQQIDYLITSLGNNADMQSKEADDPVKHKFNGVRQAFEESQKSLGSHKIRSCVLETFIISTQGGSRTQATADEKAINYPDANGFNTARTTVPTDVSPTGDDLNSFRSFEASKVARKILAYRRTVSEYGFVIQSTDISTIEAAIAGFFNDSDEHVVGAWQENLELQLERSISSFESPGRVALTLFAANFGYKLGNPQDANVKKECLSRLTMALYDSGVFAQTIVEDAPETMRSWVSNSRDYLTQYHLNLEFSLIDYVSETATGPVEVWMHRQAMGSDILWSQILFTPKTIACIDCQAR